ncbi:MAG: hypothetical protein NVS4B13_06730 [Candidatus Elarobacter sp.]
MRRRSAPAARFGLAVLVVALAIALAAYLLRPLVLAPGAAAAVAGLFFAGALLTWLLDVPAGAAAAGADAAFPAHGSGPLALPAGSPLSRELAALTTGVREVAAGDLTKNLAVADGPLADLAVGLNKLIFWMRDFLGAMHAEAERLAAAGTDLRSTASASMGVIEGGAIAQRQLEEGIVEQSQIVEAALFKVRAMTGAIGELAGSAEQQTHSLDETALNVSSMSASIEQVAAQVESLLTISSETTLTADRGGSAIHTIVDAMATIRTTIVDLGADIRRLGENSEQIGNIIKVIDRIAEQTNLLALNAAIEAARAGQHGRGFAVVANEIRKLADGNARATKDIAPHVGPTQSVIRQVTVAMTRLNERLAQSATSTESASGALRDIVTTVMDANRQIGEIGSVTRAMSENAFRVVRSIEEITTSVGANLAATKLMASHAGEVSSAFDAVASISSQNAASVEVLTYVNGEVTSSAERIVGSIDEMNRRAAAIGGQLDRYTIADGKVSEETAA